MIYYEVDCAPIPYPFSPELFYRKQTSKGDANFHVQYSITVKLYMPFLIIFHRL